MNLNPIQFARIQIQPVRNSDQIELTVTVNTLLREVQVYHMFTVSDFHSMLDIVWDEMRHELDKQLGIEKAAHR